MAFWLPLFVGVALGFGSVFAWSYCITLRAKKRALRALDIAALAEVEMRGLRKLCGEKDVPTWVSFADFERVNWLNKELKKIWPFVAKAAGKVIKESVEPILDQYRPPGTKLVFNKINLGSIPPQIGGVRLTSKKGTEVVMELDFKWGGDSSIILAVKTAAVASLQVQLKNLQLWTTVRLAFKPLRGDDFPCFGAMTVAVTKKPTLNFTFKLLGGSLGAVPGLPDMIKNTILDAIMDTLLWPKRIVVPIMPGEYSDLELRPVGKLRVTVVRAENLKKMDVLGKSDPFATLWVRMLHKEKTRTINSNLNPVWNESFELDVEDPTVQPLILQVDDEDMPGVGMVTNFIPGGGSFIGVAKVPYHHLAPDTEEEKVVTLVSSVDNDRKKDEKKNLGTVTVKYSYHPYTPEEQKAAVEAAKKKAEDKLRQKSALGMVGSGVTGAAGSVIGVMGRGATSVGSVVSMGFRKSSKSLSAPASDSAVQ